MDHEITLTAKERLTPDTWHYVFTRPEKVEFTPGQATALTLEREGWTDEDRPFTFTSQPEDPVLEFVIKSYPDHDGVTARLRDLDPGDKVQMEDPFGAIHDRGGPATFLAAGAGITPFIPILRRRVRDGKLADTTLVFSNKTRADIILREEWEAMAGLETIFVVSDEQGMIDKAFLKRRLADFDRTFYLCGPGEFVDAMRDALKALDVPGDRIVTEEGW
ncbi:FAD-binding oxidoreductase [Acidimangrovimonas sediminis]|uniref:FAD-binding oxidoreductase n=1 Tax=Acidimangrovimonas sediminis TaxID=2056283 RepID=UPI000C80F9AA|nr:FAD-binding oxidoreductase [Acidimangrovimonas sediminis]